MLKPCTNGYSQQWEFDTVNFQLHNLHDPSFCIVHSNDAKGVGGQLLLRNVTQLRTNAAKLGKRDVSCATPPPPCSPLILDCYDGNPNSHEIQVKEYLKLNQKQHVASTHNIVSVTPGDNNQCLHWSNDSDVIGGGAASSQVPTPVELKPCDSASSHQEWTFTNPDLSGPDYSGNTWLTT